MPSIKGKGSVAEAASSEEAASAMGEQMRQMNVNAIDTREQQPWREKG
jgi:hypothetical protein